MGRFKIETDWPPKEQGRSMKQRKNSEVLLALGWISFVLIVSSAFANWLVNKINTVAQ